MDFLSDWLFWAAVAGLIYNFAKLLRDYHQGKKFKWWMWILEISLLLLMLFGISFGTYSRQQRDHRKETIANNRYSESESRADAREKKLEAAINQKDQTIERQNKIIQTDSKPNMVMEPTTDSENPHIQSLTADTLMFQSYFQNIGSASATSFHVVYLFLSSDKDENPIEYVAKKIQNGSSDSKILPEGLLRGIRQSSKIAYKRVAGENLLVCAIYCYKDTLNRKYGPFHRMFEWYASMPENGSNLADQEATDKARAFFIKRGLWLDKAF